VIPVLPRADLEKMYADGDVSEIAMIGPFGNYDLYVDAMPPCEPEHDHRSLAEATRTTDQWSPNFNYECFLPVYSLAGDDAMAVIREHPEVWLEGRMWSMRATFAVATLPSESDSFAMRFLDSAFSVARLDMGGVLSTYGWGTPIYGQLEAGVDFGLLLIPLYASIILFGARTALLRVRRRPRGPNDVVMAAASFTIAFTIVIGAVAELGEQARFRTMVDPLATVVGAVLIAAAVRAIRQRQASPVGR